MALVLISTPSRTQDAVESGLSAANSQAPFEFQREDFGCGLADDGSGNAMLFLSAADGDVSSLFFAGQILKVSDFTIPARDGLYTVVSASFGTFTTIICEEPFVGGALDGIMTIIDRENYSVRIELMLPDNSAPISTNVFVYIPNQDGYLFFDLGPTLTGIMDILGSQHYAYSIRYSEVYDGVQQATSVLATPLDAVRGRRQIGKSLGANMWDWLLKPLTGGSLGRIFTDFHEPKIWKGYVRTLDILFDILLSDRVTSTNTITIKVDGMDINKVLDAATNSESILPAVWFDNPQMYAIDLKTVIELPAFEDSEYVQISVLDGSTNLVNQLICKIVQPCTSHSIMLQWLNDVGGIEQWVFGYNQQVSEDVTSSEVIEFPITQDFADVRTTKRRSVHEEVQRVTLTAENLQENEIRALKYIKSSPKLWVQLNGLFFSVVVIGSLSTEWQTQHSLHQFAVTIEMPVEFDYFEQVPL